MSDYSFANGSLSGSALQFDRSNGSDGGLLPSRVSTPPLAGGLESLKPPGEFQFHNAPPVKFDPKSLPVAQFRKQILRAVQHSDVVIITAETGAGKSTLVPMFLLEAGYRVTVTEPRRIAATSLATRVAEQLNEPLGSTVGYRHALHSATSLQTRLTYCTDGFQLAVALSELRTKHDVLVIDELHEWNLHLEGLLAHARRQQGRGAHFKLVMMSATVDAEGLSQYVGGAPIISVPGRLFPVTQAQAGQSMLDDAHDLLVQGENVLVFVPGKREIADLIEQLKARGVDAELVPLHGDLDHGEQQRAFDRFNRPKLVAATNIAQTSITIPDITAVIDSGYVRRMVLRKGAVECLDIVPISQADSAQRSGRAGRVRAGTYIWHGPMPVSKLAKFATPEIQAQHLDQVLLRFCCAGIPLQGLSFFHQPPKEALHYAHRTLKALGLMSSSDHITKLGRKIAQLPVNARIGVMIEKARLFEESGIPELRGVFDYMLAASAIIESKGVVTPGSKSWHHLATRERRSDLMAQLRTFLAALTMTEEERAINDIAETPLRRAIEIRELLHRRLQREIPEHLQIRPSRNQCEALMRCIWSGMVDRLFVKVSDGWTNGNGIRVLPRNSVVADTKFIVANPLDIAVMDDYGDKTDLPLLTMATYIDIDWYKAHAPHWLQQEHTTLIEAGTRRRKRRDQERLSTRPSLGARRW